ncbi:MAG: alkaline phosphatase [Planctomycetota bacterium]
MTLLALHRGARVAAEDAASRAIPRADVVRELQSEAIVKQVAPWGRWGVQEGKFSTWMQHSNRLIPVYTFGIDLGSWRESASPYATRSSLKKLYGFLPKATLNPVATYYDQSQIHALQETAVAAGKRHIIVLVFDGMDWQTTRAAATFRAGRVAYETGRGTGLSFQDYRGTTTDFSFVVTSAVSGGKKSDVDAQTVLGGGDADAGYNVHRGGMFPWHENSRNAYLIGEDRELPHRVTDSAASATSLFAGVKTYNASIGVLPDGSQVQPIARKLEQRGFRIGIVTSVPVSHATPASAYANNVARKDYQDISRDLLGLPSASHRRNALRGVDVLIGGGWGEGKGDDKTQGNNFMPGNVYLHESDLQRSDVTNGGRYTVVQRTAGQSGSEVLQQAAQRAIAARTRLLGFFGTRGGHLPFRTADGGYNPTFDAKGTEKYTAADVDENPTLADMTRAALAVLSTSDADEPGDAPAPFWLTVESGDVDWANHANNLDNSIGAVLSGEAAFDVIAEWAERHEAWDDTAVIVTADHGHFLVLTDLQAIADAGRHSR